LLDQQLSAKDAPMKANSFLIFSPIASFFIILPTLTHAQIRADRDPPSSYDHRPSHVIATDIKDGNVMSVEIDANNGMTVELSGKFSGDVIPTTPTLKLVVPSRFANLLGLALAGDLKIEGTCAPVGGTCLLQKLKLIR
jgi:hypothetical protein